MLNGNFLSDPSSTRTQKNDTSRAIVSSSAKTCAVVRVWSICFQIFCISPSLSANFVHRALRTNGFSANAAYAYAFLRFLNFLGKFTMQNKKGYLITRKEGTRKIRQESRIIEMILVQGEPTNSAGHYCIRKHIYPEEICVFRTGLENALPTLPVFHLKTTKRRAVSSSSVDPLKRRNLNEDSA